MSIAGIITTIGGVLFFVGYFIIGMLLYKLNNTVINSEWWLSMGLLFIPYLIIYFTFFILGTVTIGGIVGLW